MSIPLLIMDYDMCDPQIASRDNMIRQMEYFMDNAIKSRRLDK